MHNTNEMNLSNIEAIYQCYRKIPKGLKENVFKLSKENLKEIETNLEFIKFKNYINSLLELEYTNLNALLKEILQTELYNDVALNFMLLLFWIKENEFTPVEELNENEAKTIIAIYGNLKNEEIIKIFEDIKPAPIETILNKMNVQNKTQLIFKITLSKPYIWELDNFNEIIKGLKTIYS